MACNVRLHVPCALRAPATLHLYVGPAEKPTSPSRVIPTASHQRWSGVPEG